MVQRTAPGSCQHHWLIESSAEEVASGTCCYCGAGKLFQNKAVEEMLPFSSGRQDQVAVLSLERLMALEQREEVAWLETMAS